MSTAQLSAPARQALIALLLFGADATNRMLREKFGVEIDTKPRNQLKAAGLVNVSTPHGNAIVHHLTDEGREYARAELGRSAPAGTGTGVRVLYAVANVLDRALQQSGLDLDKLLHSDAESSEAGPVPDAPASVEDQVLLAYRSLAKRRGDLVSLVRLRQHLADVDRAVLDRTLKAMDRARDIQLEPDPNRRALTAGARAAAILIGGEDKHFITVGHR